MMTSVIFRGGIDENGNQFVVVDEIGPIAKECYAIMIWLRKKENQFEGDWYPYKIYGNIRPKTKRRALKKIKEYRNTFSNGHLNKFKLEKIWVSDPVIQSRTVYETQEEAAKHIVERGLGMGQPTGRELAIGRTETRILKQIEKEIQTWEEEGGNCPTDRDEEREDR